MSSSYFSLGICSSGGIDCAVSAGCGASCGGVASAAGGCGGCCVFCWFIKTSSLFKYSTILSLHLSIS